MEVQTLYAIMLVSAIGGMVSFAVYLLRRAGWTLGDTTCLVDMLCIETMLLMFVHRKRQRPGGRLYHRWPHLFTSAAGRMHLAIVLRSVPRVLYSLSFFTAAFVSMSAHTIVAGELIAVLRLASAVQAHYAHPCDAAQRLLHAEFIGNFGSQTLMVLCWLIVTHR